MKRPVRVLVVDDNDLDAELLTRQIADMSQTRHVSSLDDLRKALRELPGWDVILTDHSMPHMDTFTVLREAAEAKVDAPVIIVSGLIGEQNVARAMNEGVADYVPKDQLVRLRPALERALKAHADARAREALERDRQLFFELSADLFAITDLAGRFRTMNRAWRDTLGRADDELRRVGLRGLVHPDDRTATREVLDRLAQGKTVRGFRNRVLTADGSVRWLVWNATPERDTIHVVARDVTAQVAADEAARQQERYAALGVLVSGVAHEINNPLTYMLGNVDLIRLTLPPGSPPEIHEPIAAIERGARRIGAIVEQLRHYAHPAGQHSALVDVNAVAARVAARAREEATSPVAISTRLSATSPVRADEGEIEQILTWLARNARDATRETQGARISLTTRDVDGIVEIIVEDNGRGIAPAEAEKLFLPFFTTKAEGVGLALAVSRGIAEARGGNLRFTPTFGGGATFILALPRAAATERRSDEQEPPTPYLLDPLSR